MADARKIVLEVESVVHETAHLAAALRRLAFANYEDELVEAERGGIHRLAAIVEQHAETVLAAWHELDAATKPVGGMR